jgi:hypothetical protein
MVGSSDRHAEALDELVEWWQDLAQQATYSSAVLLPVPSRWGRTHLLNELAAIVEDDEVVSIVVRVPGTALPNGLGLQALKLRELFSDARVKHRVAELTGVDRLGGAAQLGFGVAGLFVSPLAALTGLLLASVGAGVAGKAWDDSPAGQEGMVAKLARSVAAVSVSVPVVVIIDDTDRLEPDLAVVLVENLVGRIDGQVLVVAAVDPGGDLMSALVSRAKYGLTEGRVQTVETDPRMDYKARVDLAANLCPSLPHAAVRRIGQRTRTFADVFAVASTDALVEFDALRDDAAIVTTVDEVIDAQISQAPPSRLAVVLAWAGGTMHARQAQHTLKALGEGQPEDGDDVIRFESVIRMTDPGSPRLAEQVRVLTPSKRSRLAEIVLDTALEIGDDPRVGLVDKVVAWQAAHRVRGDLRNRSLLIGVQCRLVHGQEDLGDPAAAYRVAAIALAEFTVGYPGEQMTPERDDLSAALLRLARLRQSRHADPLIDATVASVTAGGAAVGLEARIWAALDLLDQPSERERALGLIDHVAAELNRRNDLDTIGNRWRLLLAFHVGRAGYPAITQQLLDPMLTASNPLEVGDAARAVLYAVGGPGADTRLQIVSLEEELAALSADDDDDQLRVCHALAINYGDLGEYRHALKCAEQELSLRGRIQGIDRPDTLETRIMIASFTGMSGEMAKALRLFTELLHDAERVFGSNRETTLRIRVMMALWTLMCGDAVEALRLSRDLQPDVERVLGLNHHNTVMTRVVVAGSVAQCGNAMEALHLSRGLLSDTEQVLGPDHQGTLLTRIVLADSTGRCGNTMQALRLFTKLLPDVERVFGSSHPYGLTTRHYIAYWLANFDAEEALDLCSELLPDLVRVLGPNHPYTLATRYLTAVLTDESRESLRLFTDVQPDLVRVLGPDHSYVLGARYAIATLVGECGNTAEALRLLTELLHDAERVLNSDYPLISEIRNAIADLS